MNDFNKLDDWAKQVIGNLSTKQRRALTREIALDLRRTNRERIKDQKNPDGTPFEPRTQARGQSGSIRRRAMFTKLRTARFMKYASRADTAEVSFTGRVARIARVHQYGLRDRVSPNGPMYQYPQRQLLGITEADRTRIHNSLIKHIKPEH